MRALAPCAVLLCLAAAACGGGGRTQLTIVALNPNVGRAVFTVDCPASMRACAALQADPTLVTRPKPFTCAGGTSSWWDVTIAGRLDGSPVRTSFSTCWTPQMATIGRFGLGWHVLERHLVGRRFAAVLAGTTRHFPPGVLRPADAVTCTILGHRLQQGVPTSAGGASTGFSGADVASVSLTVTRNRDGSVRATCRRGSG